ncbi:hypothetical protein [Ruegeria sp. R14_0]|uniref:hypothetical protein n=1 Tax=Ruegeria sp. R14_0 TaxID=2821100 RepID=UPI001ADD3712|nr:hypothetical protein [Ruegeria sp. R14_0]MBO9446817.1 hypothetical protein [Ruegeria sp. R14_0]
MVTKAQLEAEVADLRRQLAEQAKEQTANESQEADIEPEGLVENLEAWSAQLEDVMTELEEFPHKKPILFALGIFAVGYLLGRSR